MKRYPPEKIRNVALVGHGGAGKTILAEALLFTAGAINRMGRVEDGTTVSDFDAEEQKRTQSLSLALAPFEWKGHKVNLIDTPGYADFIGDVHAALRAADIAVFVVSAVEGVEVQTDAAWKLAASLKLPRLIFVNKVDRERASFEQTLEQLRDRFGQGVAPLELPIGREHEFHGVVDLLTDTTYVYADGTASESEIPAELKAAEEEVHEALVEGIVVGDDELLERFLSDDVPSTSELSHALAGGVADATVFPVLCGSASHLIGIDRLADKMCDITPSPLERPAVTVTAGDTSVEVKPDVAGDPLAFVFKTIADPYVGHISLFRVLSGTVRPDANLVNTRSGSDERLHALFTLRGKEQDVVPEVPAGDIGAVAKLTSTVTGDTLAPKGKPVVVEPIARPDPVLATAIKPKTQADEDKLANAIHRLQEEDPALVIERSDETRQTLLKGTGETHLSITLEKLQRKFGVNVDTDEVRVPYRETISVATSGIEGRHKKQTGGHGQFGVCVINVEPRERGEGFEFVDKIVGGAISRSYIPAVQKGVEEAMADGGIYGYPVVDLRVELVDGKEHSVDSSELAFKIAGRLAIRAGLDKAGPVLLEPISLLRVSVPSEYQGDVMGDLNSRRGRVQGTEPGDDGDQVVTALVPTSEIMRYAIDLRSMTGGRGQFSAVHHHYDPMPSHLVDKVKRETAAASSD
ncbi:MAG: elongation factor G [Acidimicrobiales bacterium]